VETTEATATTAAAAETTAAGITSAIRLEPPVHKDDVSPFLLRRLSDELLGSRLASGEAAAFDELYRRYVHRLAAYGANLLGDAAAGDDVAQSALLKAYGALREGRVPERVKPWLYRIAHNTAIDLVVRRRELPTGDLPEQASSDAEPAAGVLIAAFAALPDRQRRVYVLRELHGLRIDETAAELGLTAAQVEQSLFAARNRLAEQLVFGERLNCVAVQRLTAGPLDASERRALNTHLRSCADCRSTLGARGRALGMVPGASLDWLRGLMAGLVGGGAPVAAKVGVVVAAATFAVGAPATVDRDTPHFQPALSSVPAHRAPLRHHRAQANIAAVAVEVAHATAPVTREAEHRRTRHGDGSGTSRRSTREPALSTRHDGETRDGGGGGGSGSDGSGGGSSPSTAVSAAPAPTSAVEPAVTTSTPIVVTSSGDTSHDGGGGGSGTSGGGSGTSDGGSGTTDGGGGSDGGSGGSSGPD
jgi:RNA polymerase sigma factor (sigma-70 family)